MRTTIEINDEILRQAKNRATKDSVPLRRVVESALKMYLVEGGPRTAYRLRWDTESGRLRPGVRLDSRQQLFDLMDDRT